METTLLVVILIVIIVSVVIMILSIDNLKGDQFYDLYSRCKMYLSKWSFIILVLLLLDLRYFQEVIFLLLLQEF